MRAHDETYDALHPVRRRVRAALTVGVSLVLLLGLLLPTASGGDAWVLVAGAALATLIGVAVDRVAVVERAWIRAGWVLPIPFFALVMAGTGGWRSPFAVLVLAHLLYGASFYSSRQFAGEALLAVAALVSPFLYQQPPAQHVTRVTVELLAWGAIAVVTHLVAGRIRTDHSELDASGRRAQSLFALSPVPTLRLEADGTICDLNDAAVRMCDVDGGLIDHHITELVPDPTEAGRVLDALAAAADGRAVEVTVGIETPDHRRLCDLAFVPAAEERSTSIYVQARAVGAPVPTAGQEDVIQLPN